jgi:hypothetical protein
MSRYTYLRTATLGIGMSIAILALARLAISQVPTSLPAHSVDGIIPTQLLADPIADSTPNIAQLRRGQYLVAAGDCMSCHLRAGGEPLAGGLGLKTKFGVIDTPNITSDKETGIGSYVQRLENINRGQLQVIHT